jgi:hypothetical protein
MKPTHTDNSRFELDALIDCLKTVPDSPEVEESARYTGADYGAKWYVLNGVYRANGVEKLTCRAPVRIDHDDREGLPDYAGETQEWFEKNGIVTARKGDTILMDCALVRGCTLVLEQLADALNVPLASLVSAHLHVNKREPSGRQLFRARDAFELGSCLHKDDEYVARKMGAYYGGILRKADPARRVV